MVRGLSAPEVRLQKTVFFSYSRDDEALAIRLDGDLDAAGFDSFLDQKDIPPGFPWAETIQRKLEESSSVVVVLSPQSVASRAVLDEVEYALDVGKRVVPVLYKKCNIPLRLKRLQYVDITTDYDAGLKRLIAALSDDHAAAATPEPPAPEPARPENDVRRSKTPLVAGIVAGLVILSVLAVALWRRSGGMQPSPTTSTGTSSTATASTNTTASNTLTSTTATSTTATSTSATQTTAVTATTTGSTTPSPSQTTTTTTHREPGAPSPKLRHTRVDCRNPEHSLPECCNDSDDPDACRKCKQLDNGPPDHCPK